MSGLVSSPARTGSLARGPAIVPRVAVLAPAFGPRSLARALAERLARGGPSGGRWLPAAVELVSVYAQRPEARAEAESLARTLGARATDALEDALGLRGDGGDEAGNTPVEGLVVVGSSDVLSGAERRTTAAEAAELLQKAQEALATLKRGLPIFVAPGLAAELSKARELLEGARRLGGTIHAGSLLPLLPRLPELDLTGKRVQETMLVVPGTADVLGPSVVDAALALVAGRQGGERGVKALSWLEGERVWRAFEEGRLSRRLLGAALSRSDDLQGLTLEDGRTQDMLGSGEVERRASRPAACLIEHVDGLVSSVVLVGGAVGGHTFAARVSGTQIVSTQLLLPATLSVSTAACLGRRIADTFTTGKAPWPIERALLVAGLLGAAERARREGVGRVEVAGLLSGSSIAYVQRARDSGPCGF